MLQYPVDPESSLYIMSALAHLSDGSFREIKHNIFHETCFFNKRSGAVVMSPDSEGLGAAVIAGVGRNLTQPSRISYLSLYIYISIYSKILFTLFQSIPHLRIYTSVIFMGAFYSFCKPPVRRLGQWTDGDNLNLLGGEEPAHALTELLFQVQQYEPTFHSQ